MNHNKINEYNNFIPNEIKNVIETAPINDIDWALLMYLFRHSKPVYGVLFEEKNVITIGKISKWFDLDYDDVYNRLNRMLYWVIVNDVCGYHKPFNVCYITQIGVDTMMNLIKVFEAKNK